MMINRIFTQSKEFPHKILIRLKKKKETNFRVKKAAPTIQ